mmetsp:Transcript_53115/g.133473  ORF Transcript_53115/g.133473 Transcript_53115/m.133473 type:complete len:90 (-) Transcript_53115:124-393(-)|eukprot:CAMPEP_0177629596 /NCGR_PEP_ID=MMETSP0447-20121125/754_1 /TAXON_ID=0 /ORGANISM="Stygamoeba regulata, Strain BSH-02190019" /LENGTH=89 /DNA_ID=CAMNT_0019130931 /DNA_START=75 /DNA_END=344 /DNA_ORIENTATION=+
MSDNEWDDEDALPAPKVLMTCRVTKDYIPDTNKKGEWNTLTLLQDSIVYVLDKEPKGAPPGFWMGESKEFCGIFPGGMTYIVPINENEA